MGFGIKERIVGGVGAFVLKVGDCIMAPEENVELIASVEGVPCAEPHDAQVFALFDVPDGSYDIDRIENEAVEGCVARFEGAIGRSLDNAKDLDGTFLKPSEESWAENDRVIQCLVTSADGSRLTGSALAS
jgi:hypothetical protein